MSCLLHEFIAMNRPDRRIPKRWTETEDKILFDEVQSQLRGGSEQVKDWARVAAKLPGRTNKDCRKRWINKVCGNLKRGAWDEDEDQRLRQAVSKYGQRWTLVASMVGSRSSDQCAKRWQHRLDPRLEHEDWTPEEDDLLLENVQTYGREWKFIQEEDFPTRSSNELKNRYATLSRRLSKSNASVAATNGSSPKSVTNPGSIVSTTTTAGAETDLVHGVGANSGTSSDGYGSNAAPSWMAVDDDHDWINQQFGWTAASNSPRISSTPPTDNSLKRLYVAPGVDSSFDAAASSSAAPWLDPAASFFTSPADSGGFHANGDDGADLASMQQLTTHTDWHDAAAHMDGDTQDDHLPHQEDVVGRVSLVVDHRDRDTLGHLLQVHRTLRGKGKLQIEHA